MSKSVPQKLVEHNRRTEKRERNRFILECYKRRMTAEEIQKAVERRGYGEISRSRVYAVIKRELERVELDTKKVAKQLLYQELESLNMIIRHAWEIVQAPCRNCEGTGQRNPVAGTTGLEEPCAHCRGEGKLYPVGERLKAMGRAESSIGERSKLLGLYAPDKMAFTNSEGKDIKDVYRKDLEKMSEDEISQALTDFQAGVEAAQQTGES